MTDPMNAMKSLQAEIPNGIPLQICFVHKEVKMLFDRPNGLDRFSFVELDKANKIIAFSVFVLADSMQGVPCLNVGYAVPTEERGKGLGKNIVEKSLSELTHILKQQGVNQFYVEAVIGTNNIASQKIAEKLFSSEFEQIKDCVYGSDAYYYRCLVS
ncbi:GNAT family N-acetyltransferase [Vibrio cholerae]|nr:GNAT family N-acetyltransferase [Vibrio cholerae]